MYGGIEPDTGSRRITQISGTGDSMEVILYRSMLGKKTPYRLSLADFLSFQGARMRGIAAGRLMA
jgi:hypothetical protein